MGNTNRVIALGFFDGVHTGHKALINKTMDCAEKLGCTPTVMSFDAHPGNTVMGTKVPLINTPFEREEIVKRQFGIDEMIFLHFDQKLSHMEWDRFVVWLAEDFHAVHLVAGYDFHFGYKGKGNPDLLQEKCKELGIGCDIIPRVTLGGETISSTYIRSLLLEGEIEKANIFLGHPHTMTDIVRYGYTFGRKIGIPTVTMKFSDGVLVPKFGVYSTKTYLENGEVYYSITNIGVRPTVGGESDISAETHILDFDGNLYGQKVRIEFFKFIRPEIKFPDADALKAEILSNIQVTREYFANNN